MLFTKLSRLSQHFLAKINSIAFKAGLCKLKQVSTIPTANFQNLPPWLLQKQIKPMLNICKGLLPKMRPLSCYGIPNLLL
jgi:hypothetical protein